MIEIKKHSSDISGITDISAITPKPNLRPSRKTSGGKDEDIMKELEDYVNEKKQTNKYLDDISDLETNSSKQKERMSKKYKDKLAAEKEILQNAQLNKSGLGLIQNHENQSNIDVYDYCDKMMKDLSHLDKQLENRASAKYKDNAKQLLDSYLNQAENEEKDSSLNKTNISHISHKSLTQSHNINQGQIQK